MTRNRDREVWLFVGRVDAIPSPSSEYQFSVDNVVEFLEKILARLISTVHFNKQNTSRKGGEGKDAGRVVYLR